MSFSATSIYFDIPPEMVFQQFPWAIFSSASWPFWWRIFFVKSNLNLSWSSWRPFPIVLLRVTWDKTSTHTWLQPPFMQWLMKGAPLSLLYARLNNPRSLLFLKRHALEPWPASSPFSGHDSAPHNNKYYLSKMEPSWSSFPHLLYFNLTSTQSTSDSHGKNNVQMPYSSSELAKRLDEELWSGCSWDTCILI